MENNKSNDYFIITNPKKGIAKKDEITKKYNNEKD
jgi:RNA polymerase subunit RPABC4/transcription elongation factor Spt4